MLWLFWAGLARVHSHTDAKMAFEFMEDLSIDSTNATDAAYATDPANAGGAVGTGRAANAGRTANAGSAAGATANPAPGWPWEQ